MLGFPIRMTWAQYRRRQCWVRLDLSPHETELLSLLLLRRGQIVSRDEIIEVLWPVPDDQPLDAARYIAETLCGLRLKLGSGKYQRSPILNDHGRGWMIA